MIDWFVIFMISIQIPVLIFAVWLCLDNYHSLKKSEKKTLRMKLDLAHDKGIPTIDALDMSVKEVCAFGH